MGRFRNALSASCGTSVVDLPVLCPPFYAEQRTQVTLGSQTDPTNRKTVPVGVRIMRIWYEVMLQMFVKKLLMLRRFCKKLRGP